MLRTLTILMMFVGAACAQVSDEVEEALRVLEDTDIDPMPLVFDAQQPFRIVVGQGNHRHDVFWVLPYYLENTGSSDHKFFLTITGESDKGVTYRDNQYGLVYEKIRTYLSLREQDVLWWNPDVTMAHNRERARLSTDVPLVELAEPGDEDPTDPPFAAPEDDFPIELNLPTIEAGERVYCVAVFRNLDREMDRLVITVKGLAKVRSIEKVDDHVRRVTESVLQLTYERPGDEFYTLSDYVRFVKQEWVEHSMEYRTDLR